MNLGGRKISVAEMMPTSRQQRQQRLRLHDLPASARFLSVAAPGVPASHLVEPLQQLADRLIASGACRLSAMCRLVLAALALTSASACGREPDTGLSTTPGITSVSLSSSSTGDASSSSSTSGAEDSSAGVAGSSSGTVLDMGLLPDFGPAQPPGCKGKIDFLFLIARNGTMQTEQAQLLASLPGFIATIEAIFPSFDTHIMVANPDGDWPGWNCNTPEYCGTKPYTCEPWAPGFDCSYENFESIKPCEQTLGAGILYNVGPDALNQPCVLAEGRRYIVIPGEPDPEAAFACIAPVGIGGPGAPMGDALVAAVSPGLNAEEGCNAGFLRPDALLVVTMITDTEDVESKTSPTNWYDAVVTAKGDPGAVVMLAIQPQTQVGEPKPNCTYDEGYDLRLRQLIKMFPFYAEGDTCAASYVPFFETAAGRVAEACASFIPG